MKFIFDSDTWQEIYGGIRKNKTRTVITIIGVLWGIFLLVTLLGASRGLENNFKNIFSTKRKRNNYTHNILKQNSFYVSDRLYVSTTDNFS